MGAVQPASGAGTTALLGFIPIVPCRLMDTRAGSDNVGPRSTPLGPAETYALRWTGLECGIRPSLALEALERREALRTGTAGDGACGAVPHETRAELGELVARVAAGEHVQDRVVRRLRQRRERCGATDQGERVVDVPGLQRGHRDELLREHVERVARDDRLLDLARPHQVARWARRIGPNDEKFAR